ncbi:MAG: hypothetical protein RLY14_3015, partial [Planctomycetota bacterium]
HQQRLVKMHKPDSRRGYVKTVWLLVLQLLVVSQCANPASAQEIWEFSPYRVQTWLAVDPTLAMTSPDVEALRTKLAEQLDLTFGPTWKTQIDEAPVWLKSTMLESLDTLNPTILSAGDFVLAVPKKNATTDNVRSLESFVDKAIDVMVPRKYFDAVVSRIKPLPEPPNHVRVKDQIKLLVSQKIQTLVENQMLKDPDGLNMEKFKEELKPQVPEELFKQITTLMVEKPRPQAIVRLKDQLRPTDKTSAQLALEIADGQTTAAMILKDDLQRQSENCRSIIVRLENQSDSFLQQLDKIYFLTLKAGNENPQVVVREFDCPTRQLSIIYQRDLYHPRNQIAAPIAGLVRDCFTPVARIEESDPKSAKLRVRAAGLVVAEEHPVLIRIGDVLQPIIRRNDRNGQPSLLEAIPWTYIAVTDVKREHISGAVFTGIRGGMEGRRNSRTQRVALKVKPSGTYSDVQVVTQLAKDRPLAGTQIFQRLPGGDESKILGRTDWRGQLRVTLPTDPLIVTIKTPVEPPATPAAENKEGSSTPAATPAAKNETTASAPADSKPAEGAAAADKTSAADKATAATKPAESAAPAEVPMETKTYPLNVPLVLLYVKNGETLLARLPIVVGLQPLYVAEVPDDSRRLEAEAFLRGLQSEVVDLVALRQVAAARVRLRMEEGKLDQAKQLVDELRQLKDYEKMARDLDNVQRQVLDPASGPLTPVAQLRIEKMFQQTRELLQKYLQNDLVQKVEKELDARLKGTPLPTTDAEKK